MLSRLSAAIAAIAVALGSACAQAQTKIVVAHGTAADFLPAFVAKDQGFFAKHNLDVTMMPIQTPSLVPAALAAGSAQIGINTAPNLILADEGGLSQVAIAGAARLKKDNQRIGLVTRHGVTVRRAADLKGKKIGVPGINSVIDLFLKKWLLDHNVALNEVKIIEGVPPRMGDMLKSGQLDAVAIFEPLYSRFVSSGDGVKSVDFFSEVNPDVLGSFWAATRSWASAHPSAVAGFRSSLAEGQEFIRRHPDRARKIEIKYLHFAGPRFPDFDLQLKPSDFDFFVKVCRQLGLVRKPLDTAKLIFP